MKQYDKGVSGERQAEAYLSERCGMKLLMKRYRAGEGELDLIMDDQGTVVFVEVKFRPRGRAGDGLMAVTPAKVRRMRSAALHYLVAEGKMDEPVRFDVVEMTQDGLRHVRNAF